jgi:hypothetical protein
MADSIMDWRPEGWDSREIASHVVYDPQDPQMAMLLMIEAGASAMLEALREWGREHSRIPFGEVEDAEFGHGYCVFIPDEGAE